MVGSTPFRLREAYKALKSSPEHPQPVAPQHQADNPVDICAIVLDLVAVDTHGFAPKILISLVDESISPGTGGTTTASITLRHQPFMEVVGSSIVERGADGPFPKTLLSIGDVVRFNRVQLVANHGSQRPMSFRQTWDHPAEDGHAWCRLGRFDPHMVLSQQTQPAPKEGTDQELQTSFCWDLSHLDHIPTSHQTNSQFLNTLLNWFSESPLFPELMRRLKQQLDPLPLRQRPLAQVCSSSCVGTRSNTTAQCVSHVRQQIHQDSSRSPHKRLRRASSSISQQAITIALISDTSSGATAFHSGPSQQLPTPLVDPFNRFFLILQQAEQRGCGIVMKRIQSIRARDLPYFRGSGHDESDVVILCQEDSEILIQEEEDGDDDEVATVIGIPQSLSTLTSTPPSESQHDRSQHSQVNHWMEPSQQQSHTNTDEDPINLEEGRENESSSQQPRTHGCVIQDVMMEGHSSSLPRDAVSTAQLFLNSSLDRESAEDFPPLRVLLQGGNVSDQNIGMPNHPLSGEIRWVHLPSPVVQKLCGDIEWTEFCQVESIRVASVQLLLSWWIDHVELQWEFSNTRTQFPSVDKDIIACNVQISLSQLLAGTSHELTKLFES